MATVKQPTFLRNYFETFEDWITFERSLGKSDAEILALFDKARAEQKAALKEYRKRRLELHSK